MVSYDEDGRTAGWWNDIHCSNNKSRAFVCSYDNGNEKLLSDSIKIDMFFQI